MLLPRGAELRHPAIIQPCVKGLRLYLLESKGLTDNTDIIFIGDNGNASQVAQNVDPKKAKATC